MNPKQECHDRRQLYGRALLGSLVLASMSLNACGDNQGEDSAELQAILQDGELTEAVRSMLTAPAPQPGAGMAGAGGPMAGAGGMTGAGGFVGPVPLPGIGGSLGRGGFPGPSAGGSFGAGGNGMGPNRS